MGISVVSKSTRRKPHLFGIVTINPAHMRREQGLNSGPEMRNAFTIQYFERPIGTNENPLKYYNTGRR
ncbi:hypothetical protein DPMN_038167 [Dreissena polymorpha]|uniref:Uncharacterized protein n=1 Tax=Dreissena polymorpha TaxID=45954 RepID=A0A9D4MCM0_DREPO|nr:hypothetical protein DPMN_038167 [Dreissena polymorpha]